MDLDWLTDKQKYKIGPIIFELIQTYRVTSISNLLAIVNFGCFIEVLGLFTNLNVATLRCTVYRF